MNHTSHPKPMAPSLQQYRASVQALAPAYGLPGSKNEAYMYSRLGVLAEILHPYAAMTEVATGSMPSALELCGSAAKVKGTAFASLSEAEAQHLVGILQQGDVLYRDFFTHLSAFYAHPASSTFFKVAAADPASPVVLERTLQGNEQGLQAEQRVFHIQKGASLNLLEVFSVAQSSTKTAAHFYAPSSIFILEEGAELVHVVEANWMQPLHFCFADTRVILKKNAKYTAFSFLAGSANIRHQYHVALEDSGAEAVLRGLSVGQGAAVLEQHVTVQHQYSHSESVQAFKSILTEEAKAVFSGCIDVRSGCEKIVAAQNNQHLLLSPKAQGISRPQLQVLSRDVRCSHGSAAGPLREEAIFYLQSRGIARQLGEQMLAEAFASELIATIPDLTFRTRIQKALKAELAALI